MDKLEKKFENLSQNVHLTDAEKSSMREYLLQYAEFKPVINPADTRLEGQAVKSPLSFFSFKPMPIFIAIALLLAGSAGASTLAQHALPGDILYPVKVSVNEKVAGAFAISDDAKASFETSLANTRLSEAEALSAKGALSTSTAASLEASFTAHANTAREHIARLQATDSSRAEAELTSFATVLSAHEKILAEGSDNDGRGRLVSAIRSEAAVAADLTGSSDEGASARPGIAAAARVTAAVQATSTRKSAVRALLESIVGTSIRGDDSATSSESTDVRSNDEMDMESHPDGASSQTSGSAGLHGEAPGIDVSGEDSGRVQVHF